MLGREDPRPFSTGGSDLQADWRRQRLPPLAQLMCFQFENHGSLPSPPPLEPWPGTAPSSEPPSLPQMGLTSPRRPPKLSVTLQGLFVYTKPQSSSWGGGRLRDNLRSWGPTELSYHVAIHHPAKSPTGLPAISDVMGSLSVFYECTGCHLVPHPKAAATLLCSLLCFKYIYSCSHIIIVLFIRVCV